MRWCVSSQQGGMEGRMDGRACVESGMGLCVQVHECFCVVKRGEQACAYADASGTVQPSRGSYFNSGLLVLHPSRTIFSHMLATLQTLDLQAFPFAEQDFLNAYWEGAWSALPWVYNATKGMYASHRKSLWDLGKIYIVHFTMAKPWDLKHPCHKGYERLNELWWAAFSNPATLFRTLLKLHRHDKLQKQNQ